MGITTELSEEQRLLHEMKAQLSKDIEVRQLEMYLTPKGGRIVRIGIDIDVTSASNLSELASTVYYFWNNLRGKFPLELEK